MNRVQDYFNDDKSNVLVGRSLMMSSREYRCYGFVTSAIDGINDGEMFTRS